MPHEMNLLQDPFEKIQKGIKTLEVRLYDDKRRNIKLGDEIEFSKIPETTTKLHQKIKVKVKGLLIYNTFTELFKDIPPSFMGYTEAEKEYITDMMYQIYTKEQESKYGVIGIRIELC